MSLLQNYSPTCNDANTCQLQIVDIDTASSIDIYNLNTVFSTYTLSVNDVGIIDQNSNLNGKASTVTVWTS